RVGATQVAIHAIPAVETPRRLECMLTIVIPRRASRLPCSRPNRIEDAEGSTRVRLYYTRTPATNHDNTVQP
ncbi:MAG: hypothetical protein OSW71_14860, partial [Proteobacteria bacterium]|nr:hypothetical protein [Pseudomonadota bacterium]